MRFPWGRLVEAVAAVFSRAPDPDGGLSPDARAELDGWDTAEAVEARERWRREGGGQAPPDAPHIDEGGV